MLNRFFQIFALLAASIAGCFGQDSDPGPGYQSLLISNPALSGSEGNGSLRLAYLNFYPGNNYNLHSVYLTYDSYFPALHGGAAAFLTDEYLGGIINDLHGGLSYSYYLKAGDRLFMSAGLSASFYHRGFDFTNAVLPEQIDPLGGVVFPPSELLASEGKTVFDLAAGIVLMSRNWSGGIAVSHLAEPDLSYGGTSRELLGRKVLAHFTGDIELNRSRNLRLLPHSYAAFQNGYLYGGAGAAIETRSLAFNAIVMADNNGTVNIQTGFCVMAGSLEIFYNYRFNVASAAGILPFSMLHQTGLSFVLNTIDKRRAVSTINFPKL